MSRWLQSGVRRDVCVILYGAGELREKELKRRLQDHYDDRFEPGRFRRIAGKLADSGHVERQADGIHDTYALTEAGREALEAHLVWARETTGL